MKRFSMSTKTYEGKISKVCRLTFMKNACKYLLLSDLFKICHKSRQWWSMMHGKVVGAAPQAATRRSAPPPPLQRRRKKTPPALSCLHLDCRLTPLSSFDEPPCQLFASCPWEWGCSCSPLAGCSSPSLPSSGFSSPPPRQVCCK